MPERGTAWPNLVLSSHPLSGDYKQRLVARLGAPQTFVSVQELRSGGFLVFLRALLKMHCNILTLVVEQPEGKSLLAPMRLLSCLISSSSVCLVHSEGSVVACNKVVNFLQLPLLICATIAAAALTAKSQLIAWKLNAAPRTAAKGRNRLLTCLYFKTNLWFGVKAGGSIAHVAGVANALERAGLTIGLAATELQNGVVATVVFTELRSPTLFAFPPELNLCVFDHMSLKQIRNSKQLRPLPDFIYHRFALCSLAAVLLSRELKRPLVVEYNGSEAWAQKNWGQKITVHSLAMDCERAVLKHAHLVVTVSEVLKEELVARGVDPQRIVCYPNGVDPAVFDPGKTTKTSLRSLKSQLNISENATVVGFLGTFGRWHGVEIFASAIKYLLEHHLKEVTELGLVFMLVGDGYTMPLVRQILGPFEEFCRLPGLCAQEDAPRYLALCDLVVSPHIPNPDGTRFFGSPTKLFEYMSMGKAILASRLEQIGQVLRDSLHYSAETGLSSSSDEPLALLLPPGDVESLAQAILLVGADARLRESLGANARKKALECYTWDVHVDVILTRLHSLQQSEML